MKEKKFEAVLKRSVAMFNMMTGRDLTEREGSAFIQIFDLVDEFHQPGTGSEATEAFNLISAVQPKPGLRDRPAAEELQQLNIPTLSEVQKVTVDAICAGTGFMEVGAGGAKHVPREEVLKPPYDMPRHPCGCPDGCCTCTDEMLAAVAKKAGIKPQVLEELAKAESAGKKPLPPEVPMRKCYDVPVIRNDDRAHIPGYDWQIVVLARAKNVDDSYVVHLAQKPIQDTFSNFFKLYHARTHYVHCHEWVDQRWETITDQYDTSYTTAELQAPNKVVRTAEAPELKGRDVSQPPMTSPWEEPDKPYRIRYFSDITNSARFTYVDKKPTSAQMAHFHHSKCMAMSQARPKA